jgi:hypothetical protein
MEASLVEILSTSRLLPAMSDPNARDQAGRIAAWPRLRRERGLNIPLNIPMTPEDASKRQSMSFGAQPRRAWLRQES